jgi:preprotein translocase subunit YajC
MTAMLPVPLVFAMSAPSAGNQSLLLNLVPFGLMLVIFYLLVLMPMRKRQKKIEEFRAGLKVGDKIITTGGIYGQVTKQEGATLQVQIAPNVRIEVARAAVGGYQGQEPVVKQEAGGL